MHRSRSWLALGILTLLGWLASSALIYAQSPDPTVTVPSNASIGVTWTTWGPERLSALADDGEAIWIGAADGVIRWDQATGTYRRYTAQDGLPQKKVRAVAVDEAGNRWFGGDGGLSQLSANGVWTHFTTVNSGLANDLVDGIAVGDDGTIWVSHGLPDGPISRLTPDGTWHTYANRMEAIAADYAAILGTRDANRLWTVAGTEVWAGYQAFDGVEWHDRRPGGVPSTPVATAADSMANVWALPNAEDGRVLVWDGSEWAEAYLPENGEIWTARQLSTLAVGPDDTVWIGGTTCCHLPYLCNGCFGGLWSLRPDSYSSSVPPTIAALLPITGGTWAAGGNGLRKPEGTVVWFQDRPAYETVDDILVDADDTLWLHSHGDGGTFQTLRDQGTVALDDDVWRNDLGIMFLSSSERAPNGDWWANELYGGRGLPFYPPWRRHDGQWIRYDLPEDVFVDDIFAQDDRHTWFVTQTRIWIYPPLGPGPVYRLDDGGTPADHSDDVWTTLPFTTTGGSLAVDTFDRLWFSDGAGLRRYEDGAWRVVNPRSDIRVLVPAADGTLFAQCSNREVLVVWPDGSQETLSVEQLVAHYYDRVRTAKRRNGLWAVAPDGAVWYVTTQTPPDGQVEHQIHRRDAEGLTIYPLPFPASRVNRLDVDRNNHVWLAAGGALWRMTMPPDFRLRAWPNIFLLTASSSVQAQVQVASQEWFTGAVTLTISGWPDWITATFDPNPVTAGSATTMTIQVGDEIIAGIYPALLVGQNGTVTHTTPVQAFVAPSFYDRRLPLLLK